VKLTISDINFDRTTDPTQVMKLLELLSGLEKSLTHVASSEKPAKQEAILDERFKAFNMNNRANLSREQVEVWMSKASEKTKAGLRAIAEHGPITDVNLILDALGLDSVEKLPHFQSRTTIRTRTVTGDTNAFLLGWDVWKRGADGKSVGHYVVTPLTYASLRQYFGLS
jgi:hypothetical protein